jgi:hypothetical protein
MGLRIGKFGAQERFLRLEQAKKLLAPGYLQLDFRAVVWMSRCRTGEVGEARFKPGKLARTLGLIPWSIRLSHVDAQAPIIYDASETAKTV